MHGHRGERQYTGQDSLPPLDVERSRGLEPEGGEREPARGGHDDSEEEKARVDVDGPGTGA